MLNEEDKLSLYPLLLKPWLSVSISKLWVSEYSPSDSSFPKFQLSMSLPLCGARGFRCQVKDNSGDTRHLHDVLSHGLYNLCIYIRGKLKGPSRREWEKTQWRAAMDCSCQKNEGHKAPFKWATQCQKWFFDFPKTSV